MMARSKQQTFVLLDEASDGTVTVVPRDQETLWVKIEEAVKAFRILDDNDTFIRQAGELREALAE